MPKIASNSYVQAFFGARYPILQAGMGGVAQPELAAAVCQAGAFGMIGLYRHTETEIGILLTRTAALTSARFGVNLVPFVLNNSQLVSRVAFLADRPERPVVMFFGLPERQVLQRLPAGLDYGAQVGSLDDLEVAFDAGFSFGVLQTVDAGGHHLGDLTYNRALDFAEKLRVRERMLFLSGGISNAMELRQILQVGYAGALCGTIFSATREAASHNRYKQAIVCARPEDTVVTDCFHIGWHTHRHRVIRNRTCDGALASEIIGFTEYFGKRYPIPRYSVAVPTNQTVGRIEEMALYCGTSCKDINSIRTVQQVLAEMTT